LIGVDLISDVLPFGRLWYDEPNAISNAIGCAQFYSRSHDAKPSDIILQFTTPEFGALLKREWAYSNGEIGHLDYDP
jgi:hypothetical protein